MNKYNLLSNINSPFDLKKLDYRSLCDVSEEIRDLIIDTVSKNGGHLASNLGVVELTVALHKTFDAPVDSLVFDVSHQCYAHKILTGRFNEFSTIRTSGGLTGFTNYDESEYDLFKNGHSGTSISEALGIATAKSLKGDNSYTIAVIGDGSLGNGLAYEGLNNAGHSNTKLIIVINDNKMSISKNVGGLARHLAKIRYKSSYHKFKGGFERFLLSLPLVGKGLRNLVLKIKKSFKNILYHSNIFEDMGYYYLGPVDGHNINDLCNTFESAKLSKRPAIVHVITKKGYGYTPAQENPKNYHSTGNFEIKNGIDLKVSTDFSIEFGKALCKIAESDENICAITAAMTDGTGLCEFKEKYKNRFFDVGIAEEHAITFASGLAKQKMKPVFAVYSTFLQRAYDEILHDVSLQKNGVVLAVDRAGIVGIDGETHQGIFDVSFLTTVPGVKIYSPCFYSEIEPYLLKCFDEKSSVSVIRFPRGKEIKTVNDITLDFNEDFSVYNNGNCKYAVISYGRIFSNVYNAVNKLSKSDIKIIKLNKIFPLNTDSLKNELKNCEKVLMFEEGIYNGSISQYIESQIKCCKFDVTAFPNDFIVQDTVENILDNFGMSEDKIYKKIIKEFNIGREEET